MRDLSGEEPEANEQATVISGPGALCPEAQADGVPCEVLEVDCAECERARPTRAEPRSRPGRVT